MKNRMRHKKLRLTTAVNTGYLQAEDGDVDL
jgi:hypothetical protein